MSLEYINRLAYDLQQKNRLKNLLNLFTKKYFLLPCIGVEIEFYLSHNIDVNIFNTILEEKIGIKVKLEKGNRQFEIDIPPSTDIISQIHYITNIKIYMQKVAEHMKGQICFDSKPFLNDYGNSMHIHLNLIPSLKSNSQIPLDHIIMSICHFMLPSFLAFAPNESDYARFNQQGLMAPTHVSYGNNNRSVAVRIPDSLPKRLEHRIASPLTNPYLAVFTILQSIALGLEQPSQITFLEKTYGNAYDTQYNLQSLPSRLSEARKLFDISFFYQLQ